MRKLPTAGAHHSHGRIGRTLAAARRAPALGAILLAADINISPNETGLPGISTAKSIVGALMSFGLYAAVAGVIIFAIVLGVSKSHGSARGSSIGLIGLVVCVLAAMLTGGAVLIVNFFSTGAGKLA